MSFLAPLFLAGAALVLFPVIFHLIKRTPRDRRYFSSLIFLSPSPPRVTKKSRLDNLLLLALRCLAICLLAFAFTRPYFKKAVALPAAANQNNLVLLVDKSASMQQEGLWANAVKSAEEVLGAKQRGGGIAAYLFDRSITPLLTLEDSSKLPENKRTDAVLAKLRETKPGWAATHLGASIISAVELLHDPKQPEVTYELVVLSDFQEGAKLEGLQGYEWPKGWKIQLRQVKAKEPNNAGLSMLSDSSGLKVRVVNAAGSKSEQFKLIAPGAAQESPLDLYVPSGQSRTVTVPTNFISGPVVSLSLFGDDNKFDNELRWVPPRGRQVTIAYIGPGAINDPAEPGFYLGRAFQNVERNNFVVTNYSSPAQLISGKPDLVVFSSMLDEQWSPALRQLGEQGKSIFVSLPEGSQDLSLLGDGLRIEEIKHEKYGMLGYIDFQHPLFSPFNDPRFSDFTKISFWKHRKVLGLPENTRVIARFDNKDPALIDIPAGQGRIFILTTTWKPTDSQLALSSKFVPLLYSALAQNGAWLQTQANWLVGDLVPLPKGAASVQAPDGKPIGANHIQGEYFMAQTPGIYTVEPSLEKIAVNLSPDESRTAPMLMDDFKRLGMPVEDQKQGANLKTASVAGAIELENQQKLWRWILLVVVLVLLVETIVAGRISRRISSV